MGLVNWRSWSCMDYQVGYTPFNHLFPVILSRATRLRMRTLAYPWYPSEHMASALACALLA
ncbi:hypothetical protein P280DRAFT_171840 [Massarina eburnea CBS 473.64]|uniref:Uncharacterized protein n=1 Tax=Massarina eburnea CBS 473.64 TaxID=1395130 RepID=A0A6A6SC84_9PLEO|nr:hypothetical protein P280DRAFT_171840 [Massarina eburnea CBS 473.64]